MSYSLHRTFQIERINTIFTREWDTNYYFQGEMHNFWEMVYVPFGEVAVSEDERVYELKAGDIIFHKPMEFHKIWARGQEGPRVCIMSFFTSGTLPDVLSGGVMHLNSTVAASFLKIFQTGLALEDNAETRTPFQIQRFALDFERFILSLATETAIDKRVLDSPDALRYRDIIRIMQTHLTEDLSVDDIARLTHMAPSTMKAVFAKFSSGGVKKHFNRLKLVASLADLQRGISISEISRRFAYSSQNYYAMVFKEEMGCSPLEYKKKYFS